MEEIKLNVSLWNDKEKIVFEDVPDMIKDEDIEIQVDRLFYFLRHCIPSEVVKRTFIRWLKMTRL